jgi:hypothetical protein
MRARPASFRWLLHAEGLQGFNETFIASISSSVLGIETMEFGTEGWSILFASGG